MKTYLIPALFVLILSLIACQDVRLGDLPENSITSDQIIGSWEGDIQTNDTTPPIHIDVAITADGLFSLTSTDPTVNPFSGQWEIVGSGITVIVPNEEPRNLGISVQESAMTVVVEGFPINLTRKM